MESGTRATSLLTRRIKSPEVAASIIRDGGLVAFPTETVFGLGVDATNEAAVERLFRAKGRPSDNPLIVHLSRPDDWRLAAAELTRNAQLLLNAFAPGPITVVLPKNDAIGDSVTAGLATVGIRVPDHAIARTLLRAANRPVAAPSANLSGRPSGVHWKSVLDDLDGRVDAVLCDDGYADDFQRGGEPSGTVERHESPRIGIESTVVDCCGDVPIVLRTGAVTLEQLRRVVPSTKMLASVAGLATLNSQGRRVNSPGLLHPHYQPQADVRLIDAWTAESIASAATLHADRDETIAYCGMDDPKTLIDRLELCARFSSVDEYAANFYEFLREADRHSVTTIFVQRAPCEGIGAALLDRQRRAAS